MRVVRAALIGLAGLVALLVSSLAILVWVTGLSARDGEFLLGPKTPFSQGSFFAFVQPWGGETVPLTRQWSGIADAMTVTPKRFPAETRIRWRWPPYAPSNGPGVWAYNYVSYGDYYGGPPEDPVPPIKVRDLKVLRQAFDWSMSNRFGDANVLTEFYLRSSTTDAEAIRIEIGWFLHAPENMRRFFESSRLIGRYVDPSGRRWVVRMADRFCMFAPEVAGDLPSGTLDMLDALRWLRERGLITGEEWLWGVAIGAEPVTGMGDMTLHSWRVDRR